MNDQTLADKVRELAAAMRAAMRRDDDTYRDAEFLDDMSDYIRDLEALLPAPPTLVDIPRGERASCQWMQADTETWGRVVILLPEASGGLAILLNRWGKVIYEALDEVTPRPDLPRMTWPGEQQPTPALPGEWRLADHPDHGRIIVTRPEPDRDGKVAITVSVPTYDDRARLEWCRPAVLTYIDNPTAKEDDTPTGPDHLAVGTVIESADDPRIDALPAGSILLDRHEEATIKGRGDWTGEGYIPIPPEGAEFGPWKVIYLGRGADQ